MAAPYALGRLPAPRPPGLALWALTLDPDAAPPPPADAADAARAAAFVRPTDRARFLACRAALRRLAPGLAVETDPGGRPRLSGGPAVSLAHTGRHGLIALSRAGPVGVDIEPVRRDLPLDALAAEALAPDELAAWCRLPPADRPAAFAAAWTAKEAVLKALGLGLTVDPRRVVVAQARVVALPPALGVDPAAVRLLPVAAPPGHAAACALLPLNPDAPAAS